MTEIQTQIKWNLNIQTVLEIPVLDDEYEGTLDEEIEAWLEADLQKEPMIEVAPDDFEKLYGWFYS